MPDPRRLLTTLERAAQAFASTPRRRGRVVELPAGAEVMVVGDLHGNVENFRRALVRADLAKQSRRHLVFQEVVHGPFPYPHDGGDKSHQVLDLLAALKCQYPERVHFLLGNHELAQWLKQRIGKSDIDQNAWFERGVTTAYGEFAAPILKAYDAIFAVADLALRAANRVFLSHSYPPAATLDRFSLSILESEPIPAEAYRNGGAVHGITWGRDLSQTNVEAFLRKVDADWIITGHIPCAQGFMTPNDRQIVLDALGDPACYLLFPTDRETSQQGLLACLGTL